MIKKILLSAFIILFVMATRALASYEGAVNIKINDSETITLGSVYSRVLQYNATGISYRWYSSNTSVATVSYSNYKSCIVRGKTEGKCKVYFSASFYIDGYYRTYDFYWDVTVSGYNGGGTIVNPTSATLSPSSLTLDVGQTYKMSYNVYPTNATYTVEWVSYKENIVTISNTGVVTAVAPGTAYVYLWVFRNDGGCDIVETCNVTVNAQMVTSLQLMDESLTLERGTTTQLQYILLPSEATNKTVIFESSDEGIASIDKNGVISAIKQGDCTITVATTDGSNISASCNIHVIEPYKLGDINEDGEVSIADVTSLVNIILEKQSEIITGSSKDHADINGDGQVNITDVASLINIILGKTDLNP